MKEILVSIDDGKTKLTLCPNHALAYLLWEAGQIVIPDYETEPSEIKKKCTCEICSKKAYQYKDDGQEYHLCQKHLSNLIAKNLAPHEYTLLRVNHPFDRFILHDDFYDKNGRVLQPFLFE